MEKRVERKLPELVEILKTYDPEVKVYIQRPRATKTLEEMREEKEKLFDLVESMHPALGVLKLKHIIDPKNPLFKILKNVRLRMAEGSMIVSPDEVKVRPGDLNTIKISFENVKPEELKKKLTREAIKDFIEAKEFEWLLEKYKKIGKKPLEEGFLGVAHFPQLYIVKKIEKQIGKKLPLEEKRRIMDKISKKGETIKIAEEVKSKPETVLHEIIHILGRKRGNLSGFSEDDTKSIEKYISAKAKGTVDSLDKETIDNAKLLIKSIPEVSEDDLVDVYKDLEKFFTGPGKN